MKDVPRAPGGERDREGEQADHVKPHQPAAFRRPRCNAVDYGDPRSGGHGDTNRDIKAPAVGLCGTGRTGGAGRPAPGSGATRMISSYRRSSDSRLLSGVRTVTAPLPYAFVPSGRSGPTGKASGPTLPLCPRQVLRQECSIGLPSYRFITPCHLDDRRHHVPP